MDPRCRSVQLAVMEFAGDTRRLDLETRAHLAACAACAEVAAAEGGLERVLELALPPANPALVDRTLAALPQPGPRRRALAFLPVAASLALAALGAFGVGGVPGVGLLALLPGWSSNGWSALAGAAGDWGLALVATAQTSAQLLPPAVALGAAALSLGGGGLVVFAVRRWRGSPWWRPNA